MCRAASWNTHYFFVHVLILPSSVITLDFTHPYNGMCKAVSLQIVTRTRIISRPLVDLVIFGDNRSFHTPLKWHVQSCPLVDCNTHTHYFFVRALILSSSVIILLPPRRVILNRAAGAPAFVKQPAGI